MVRVGLFVRLQAAEGRAAEVAEFLRNALDLVQQEARTPAWYALQLGPSTFGIFDAFADESDREAHLDGPIAQGIREHGELFAEPPAVEPLDILASK